VQDSVIESNKPIMSQFGNNSLEADSFSMEHENEYERGAVGHCCSGQFAVQYESILGTCFLEAASLRNEVFLAHKRMDELFSQNDPKLMQDTKHTGLDSPETTAQLSSGFQNQNDQNKYLRGCVPPSLSHRARVSFI
jgi:hypothetical protein